MDSFFGIGLFELVMIAVVALIVLGPERLPGAMREVAKWMRQLRNLSSEFQSQFSEEFKMLDELNPRRIINEAIDPNATPGASARPGTGQPAKPAAAQPVTPPASKPLAPKPPAPKPMGVAAPAAAPPAPAAPPADDEVQNSILPPAKAAAAGASSAPASVEPGPAPDRPLDAAPPQLADAGKPEPGTAQ